MVRLNSVLFQSAFHTVDGVHYSHPLIHKHIHTPKAEETMQGANLLIVSNWCLSVFEQDTEALTLGESGIEL